MLDLSSKGLSVPSAIVIASLIGVNAVLTKISLAHNQLGEEGTKSVCEALKSNKTLVELDLSGIGYGASTIGGPAGAKHVADMLRVNAVLTNLE